ncbi:MAG: MFS transporter [Solirubrobacteraceae bacterium]
MITGGCRVGGSRTPVSGPLVRVLAGWLLVSSAGWAVTTAIAVYAFDRAGAAGVAVIALARLVSAAVAAPAAGAALERFGGVRVVTTSCLAQASCLVAAGGLVIAASTLALVAVMAITGAVTAAARPGLQALLAGLSRSETERADVTAAWSALDSAGFLLGAGIAGAAMVLAGAAAVCAGAALATMVSAALVGWIRSPTMATARGDCGAAARPLDGLRTVLGTPTLHAPFLFLTGLMLLEGTTDVQLVAVSHRLQLGDGGPGLMFCLWGIGGLASSLLVRLLVRRRGYAVTIAVGAIGFGLALGLAGLSGAALTLVAMPLTGIGFGLVETGVMGIIPQLCDDHALGRVYGLSELIYGAAVAIGVLLAPLLITTFGAGHSITMIGLAFALATMLSCGIRARPAPTPPRPPPKQP